MIPAMPVNRVTLPRPSGVNLPRIRWAAFCLFAYLLLSLIGVDPFAKAVMTAQTAEGSIANQVVGIGLVLLLLVTTWRSDLRATMALPISLMVLLGYCAVTIGWSIVPDIAVRRWSLTVLTIWVLFRAVAELGYGRALFVLRGTTAILLAINFFAVMFLDGVHHFEIGMASTEAGDWRGIMIHKNIAGAVTALTVILFLFDRRNLSLAIRGAMITAALIFLYFTHSKASMSALPVAVLAGWGIRHFRFDSKSHLFVYAVMLVLVLVPLGAAFYGNVIEQLNDPTGFTGRSSIWAVLVIYAQNHLWTGTGFDSFWQVGDASPIWGLTHGWVAELASGGHNGYLDLLVTIGLPGLLLALVVLFLLPVQRLLVAREVSDAQRSLLLAIIVFCACNNLAESQLLDRNAVDQLFLVLAIALIGRIARPVHHRSARELAHAALARLGLEKKA